MKVLLCLCACIAASSAGIIGYPVAPLAYQKYFLNYPLTTYNTITYKPLGFPFTGVSGFPYPLGPSYYSVDVIPQDIIIPGIPGVFHYIPEALPGETKPGKPGKKKPGDKKEDKDSKEETTEETKKEETTTSSGSETEELAQ